MIYYSYQMSLEFALQSKHIQLNQNEYITNGGIIKKISIGDRYFFIYINNDIDYNDGINLLLFYHGSRDIAMNCILSTTSLIKTFGSDKSWIVVFGQCDGIIQDPYIHKGYGKIAYGEIYWGITGVQNMYEDIEYTKNIVQIMSTRYNINKKAIMGHSNGGVFSLLIPIFLSNLFDFVISHQGGIGFDPLFGLDFHLVNENDNKPKILFYTGSNDIHKNVCKIAHNIFLAKKYETDIIIIDGLDHNYKKECEPVIKSWIEKLIL